MQSPHDRSRNRNSSFPHGCGRTRTLIQQITLAGLILVSGWLTVQRAPAQGYTFTNIWTGAGSDAFWPTAANWTNNAVPSNTCMVWLTNYGVSGFPGTNGAGAVGTPNIIVSNDTSIASLFDMHTNLFGPATLYHTIQISNGVTLTISNGPVAGTNVLLVISQSGSAAPSLIGADYGAGAVLYNTIQGSGRLAVIATNNLGVSFAKGNIFVGQGSGGTGGALNSVLDLSGLDTFDADVNHILLGDGGVAGFFINRPVGTIYFAKTNNLRLWAVGNHPSAGSAANGGFVTGISALNGDSSRFGRYVLGYTNTMLCNNGITFGCRGYGGWMGFNPSNAPGSSVAYFRNLANTGRQTRWSIADRLGAGNGASQNVSCELDFSLGVVDALVGTLTIGVNNQVNGLTGNVEFGAGTIDVNTLQIGVQSASTGYAQGSLTVSNSGVLRVNTSGTMGGAVGTGLPNYFARLIVTNGGTAVFSNTAPVNCGVGARSEIHVTDGSALSVYTVGSAAAPLSYLKLASSTLTVDRGTASNPTTGGIVFANELDLAGANTINMLGAVLVVGQFPIIKYGSIVNGGFANLTLGSTSAGVSGYLSNNVANSSIDFVVTSSATVTLVWDGQTNSVPIGFWDVNTTPNWQGALKYLQPSVPGSLVVFDDTATGTTTVAVPTNISVAPAVFTVNNTSKNYAFGGTNISGPTALLKNGTGSITFSNTSQNTFSGGVFVNDGTLIAGAVNTLPTATVTVGNLATAGINLNNQNQNIGALAGGGGSGGNVALGSANLTLSSGSASYGGVISGTGRVIKTGSGTQTLTAANTYSGGTAITNAGILAAADNALGTGGIYVSTNGTLQLGNGAADGLVPQAYLTNVSGTLSVYPANSYTFTNQIVSTNGSFIKLIGNTTALTITNGNPNMTGAASIQQGSIVISHPNALGTGSITVGNVVPGDCFLGLAGGINVTNPITLSGKTGALNPSPAGLDSQSGTNTLYGNITLTGSTLWSIGTETGSKLIINSTFVNSGPVGGQQLNLRGTGEGVINKPLINGAGNTLTVSIEDAGQWKLTATNTYSGPTLVNGGQLTVDGALANSSYVKVLNGATLSGAGRIAGAVTNSGKIDLAGDGVLGSLTISNALLTDGEIVLEVSTNGNDRIRGLTTMVMDGTLTIVLNGTLTGNAIFKLFDATNYVGVINTPALPPLDAPLTWDTSYLNVDGTLHVVGGPVTTPVITAVGSGGPSGFYLSGTGTMVAPFSILASTNVAAPLVDWVNVGGGTFSNGSFWFNDLTATNYPQRYYLISSPTP